MKYISANLAKINQVLAGREVEIIAVTKKYPSAVLGALDALGITHFAENYAQELAQKRSDHALKEDSQTVWCYQGTIQSNKINTIVRHANIILSLSKTQHLSRIAQACTTYGKQRLGICIQVASPLDSHRNGIALNHAHLREMKEEINQYPQLQYRGLMTVLRKNITEKEKEKDFCAVAEHYHLLGGGSILSMGMSGDYHLAVKQGSTHIRLGTALLGREDNKQ